MGDSAGRTGVNLDAPISAAPGLRLPNLCFRCMAIISKSEGMKARNPSAGGLESSCI